MIAPNHIISELLKKNEQNVFNDQLILHKPSLTLELKVDMQRTIIDASQAMHLLLLYIMSPVICAAEQAVPLVKDGDTLVIIYVPVVLDQVVDGIRDM